MWSFEEIKAQLALKGIKQVDLAQSVGLKRQELSTILKKTQWVLPKLVEILGNNPFDLGEEEIRVAQLPLDENKPVLIVDDDIALRQLLSAVLKKRGVEKIIEAENGHMALDILESVEVGLVITDIKMPVMDGLELSKLIRSSNAYETIPIIVLTAVATDQVRMEAFRSGIDGYLVKPLDTGIIMQKIEEAVQHRLQKNEIVRSQKQKTSEEKQEMVSHY